MLLFFNGIILAQEYAVDQINIADGLGNNTVNCTYQDHNGYVWIGTTAGLFKYDGSAFKEYGLLTSPSIPDANIRCLIEDERGNIWIGTESSILILNPQNNSISKANTKINCFVQQFFKKSNNEIWAIGQKIFQFSNLNFVREIKLELNAGSSVELPISSLQPVFDSMVIMAFSNNVLQVGKYNSKAGLIEGVAKIKGQSYCVLKNKLIVIDNGLYIEYTTPKSKETKLFNALGNLFLQYPQAFADNQNSIWYVVNQNNLFRFSENGWKVANFTHLLGNSNRINHLMSDNFGNIWVSSTKGLFILHNKTNLISKIPIKDANGNEIINIGCRKILAYKDKYYAAFNANLVEISRDNRGNYNSNMLVAGPLYQKLLSDPNLNKIELELPVKFNFFESVDLGIFNNTLWSCGAGIQKFDFDKNKLTTYVFDEIPANDDFHYLKDNLCFVYHQKRIWIGGTHNLYIFDELTEKFSVFVDNKKNEFFNQRIIWDIAINNNLLYLATDKGLFVIDLITNSVSNFTNPLLQIPLNCIMFENSNILWLGTTASGIVKLNIKTNEIAQFTKKNGLSSDAIAAIFFDKNRRMWISTYFGLNYFNKSNNSFINYYSEDGLNSDELNRKSFYVLQNGNIIVGGVNGYNIFNPDALLKTASSVKIKLNSIVKTIKKTNGKILTYNLDLSKDIEIEGLSESVELQFSLNNYFMRSTHKYYYKIEGLHDNWQLLENKNSITINALPPGNYKIRIIGSLKNGGYAENEIVVPIRVLQVFYKRWWFILIWVLAIVGIAYYLVYLRIRQLNKMNALRTKLASDLHDEVGGNLVQIALLTENLSRSKSEDTSEVKEKIADISRNAVTTMRDVVWSVDSRNDLMANLVEKMQEHMYDLLSPLEINYTLDTQNLDMNKKLEIQVRQNIFLFFKECINNISKHSNAQEVKVSLNQKNGKLYLKIHDNGSSIDIKSKHSGQGLNNLEMRTKYLNAEMKISTQNGFTVELWV